MYQVIFTKEAANQYADIVGDLESYPKKLQTFQQELEIVISRLRTMPTMFPPKGNMRAARLRKSSYYLFFRIEEIKERVVAVMLIHQQQDPSKWPH